jgi:hypothetical protein
MKGLNLLFVSPGRVSSGDGPIRDTIYDDLSVL